MIALHRHRGAEVDGGERNREERDDQRGPRLHGDCEERSGREQHRRDGCLVTQVRSYHGHDRRPGTQRDGNLHEAEVGDEISHSRDQQHIEIEVVRRPMA